MNPNETALASAALTREVTVAVFISIWVLVILGAVFNALTITRPVKELLRGVRSVASGNFGCLLYTSPSPRDGLLSRMPSSA